MAITKYRPRHTTALLRHTRAQLLRQAVTTLLLIVCTTASAQQRVRIYGTVKDDKGDPVELASVRVQGQPVFTTAGLSGEYSLYCTSRDTVTVVYR